MVQGGYNVALAKGDSVARHFMDTIEGGKWLPNQELAWTLCEKAVERIHELENELGCFFDRNPDGTMHQKAFAGQTFDRTVHKGDLTGIEIINRLAEQVWARDIHRLEEHRAIELIRDKEGQELAGVLMIDVRSGSFKLVRAKAVLLATGGGPTMYKYHTPSGDKSCDGIAMALRAGLTLRDMEMVQFHPTGLIAGEHTRITGTIIEEGLRGAGGWLLNGEGNRFMSNYDPRNERATRDIVSRGIYSEMRAGRTSPNGGVYITMAHLGPDNVRRQFKGMVDRCRDCGFDLAGGKVEVVPTAHYMMGGVIFDGDCQTELPRLFAAGEDTGGVHGANRLGGNGVANSTVFGGIAGDAMAGYVRRHPGYPEPNWAAVTASIDRHERPFSARPDSVSPLREKLQTVMWNKAGILRDSEGLRSAATSVTEMQDTLNLIGLKTDSRAYHLGWHEWMNLQNLLQISRVIIEAAQVRENSRGAHFREDFPEPGDLNSSTYTCATLVHDRVLIHEKAVDFTLVRPGESLLQDSTTLFPPANA
jgi:fumarate reductase flavoprotein subunit